MTTRLVALGLLVVLAGCTTTDPDPDGKRLKREEVAWVDVSGRDSQTLEIDLDYDWDDIDIADDGTHDPYIVAKWVKERRDAVQRCLSAVPADQVQAADLLDEILKRVPGSSRDRGLLAQVTFADASYWFQTADRVGWEVERLRVERTATANGETLNDKDLEDLVESYTPYLETANKKCQASARRSLGQWDLYRKLRPDDRAVADFIWKLHFYVQDYRSALAWLDLVLREMDLQETPKEEPIRRDYEEIRRSIVEYLAKLRLEGPEAGRRVLPFGKRGSSSRDRLGDFTPGG